ncbi:MAG: D-alanyl-D-alanine carboxypeptidase family protein [Verrucomicrobiales bacterium]
MRQVLQTLLTVQALGLLGSSFSQADTPEILGAAGVVIDSFTGQRLHDKQADQRMFPASTTKIMTALLVIEAGNLERLIEVELSDTQVVPVSINLKPGDLATRRQLLNVIMVHSANDAAMTLARDHSGSVEAFAEDMTRRAHQLGAVSTQFRNPHGLHHAEHWSTAHDLALITRYALQQPAFRQLAQLTHFTWQTGPDSRRVLTNRNRLLADYSESTGVKTGYTRAAGRVLVSSAVRDRREVIAVVMKTTNQGIWSDSRALLQWGFEELGY